MLDLTKNAWYRASGSATALIFVHGIYSDNSTCWTYTDSATGKTLFWPDLILDDDRTRKLDVFMGGYYSSLNSGAYSIRDAADALFRDLARGEAESSAVLSKRRLVFVCHSTGGIVARYLLDNRREHFSDKVVGLFLVASPSLGAHVATHLSSIARIYNQKLALQLRHECEALDDLDSRFKDLVDQKRIPKLAGMELFETKMVYRRAFFSTLIEKWIPNWGLVVDKRSAGRYFGDALAMPNQDHFSIVKPDSNHHPTHKALVDFLAILDQRFPQTDQPSATLATQQVSAVEVAAMPHSERLLAALEHAISPSSNARYDRSKLLDKLAQRLGSQEKAHAALIELLHGKFLIETSAGNIELSNLGKQALIGRRK